MMTLLQNLAMNLRVDILQMIQIAQSGHPGGSLSAIDLMTALFFHEMSSEDRFVLSKGHAVPALYAILAKKNKISVEELTTLRKLGSRLQGHPDRVRLPEVEASTGSLGQGLSIAMGMALGFQQRQQNTRVFCLIGDGEMQEGQIWEAAMSAPKFQLSRLCVILDYNRAQIDGLVQNIMPIEPILAKWEAFGWHTLETDGHSMPAILQSFEEIRQSNLSKPHFLMAHTIKGKGVSFMENQFRWHGTAPTLQETELALRELQS